ncbi:MAG: hypothetical protein ACXADY_09430 [Candidatus Hodarchaeales archaeon]|jgi:hypothetical protein
MVPTQLLFLSFILIILVLLSLLALNIDLLIRILSRKESWEFGKTDLYRKIIGDINRKINLHAQSESSVKDLIRKCPVEAITLVVVPEKHLIVSEIRCLGYSCLECLR